MSPNRLNLIICLSGTFLWIVVLVYHLIRISVAKKKLLASGGSVDKAAGSYVFCIVICAVASLLPYLILFKPYVTAVLEGCSIFGTWSIMKERLEKLIKALGKD